MNSPLHHSFDDAARLDPDQAKSLLGGKGESLVRMTAMGLPVPPGFIVTTTACHQVADRGWSQELDASIEAGIAELEAATRRQLGTGALPLLLSVRSGAPVSMPGMMDTVLNVGMNDDVAAALGAGTGDEWFGWDTARRFVQSYSVIVLGASNDFVREITSACIGPRDGRDLAAADLAIAVGEMRTMLAHRGYVIPSDPHEQVTAAVGAVFTSWESARARAYRKVEHISDTLGTAATVQMMTFGNLGERSGTGVVFTRDPATGANGLVGDFLVGAQGEDVVAGTHVTLPISELRSLWPEVAMDLDRVAAQLEHDLRDVADIEFTVEDGTLWLLQVRPGKCSPSAALRVVIDLVEDPTFALGRSEALDRIADVLAHPPMRANPAATHDLGATVLATGLAASPGRAVGQLCTNIDEAIAAGTRGDPIVLARAETSPSDIAGMAEARGLVTTRGGFVSHAAVIARSWSVPAVVGASSVVVEADGIRIDGIHVAAGTTITVDGDRGIVLLGDHPAELIEVPEVAILRRWQHERANGEVQAHLDPPSVAGPATVEACERVLALKGAATAETVAHVLGCALPQVEGIVADLVADGSAQALPGERVRLLADASSRVDARFGADALHLGSVIEPLWDRFHQCDHALKHVVMAWQVRDVDGEQVPNDHADADYDAAVIARLHVDVHAQITPILDDLGPSDARFVRYRERLEASLSAIADGDRQMVAHPVRDSYHTIWFELHEELIRLTGRTRAGEAAAGRA